MSSWVLAVIEQALDMTCVHSLSVRYGKRGGSCETIQHKILEGKKEREKKRTKTKIK